MRRCDQCARPVVLPLTVPKMGGFAGSDLATAVSQAGGLGQIGAVFDMEELSGNLEEVEQNLDSSHGVLPVGVGYEQPSPMHRPTQS